MNSMNSMNLNTKKNVFVYYWKTEEKPNYTTELRIYGVDEENVNTCIRIEKCKTRCTLECSDDRYLVENFDSIKNSFRTIIFNENDKASIKLVYKKKLYGCHLNNDGTAKLFPFVEIIFSGRIGMFSFRKKIRNLNLKVDFKFHEINASTELQFMVRRNLYPSGWLSIENTSKLRDFEKITSCDNEYIVKETDVHHVEMHKNVDLKIMAWDIEAKCKDISKNPGRDVDDCVFQISCVFDTLVTKKQKKILLTLGECEELEGVEIRKYVTEKDLILGFAGVVLDEKPNIITGWNIFTFDTNFMISRAEQNMCLGEFCCFGFLKNKECDVVNLKWSSKAFSTTDIKYIDCEGILSIDLIEVVRKDYKLDSYSLNNVSKHFLKEEKDDITFKDIMYAYKCYTSKSSDAAKEFTKVGKYCVQDSKLVVDLFDKLQTFLGLSEMSRTTSTTIVSVHLNGQQKKFFNQIYKYCYARNIVVESDAYKSRPTDRYAGAYVFDPIPGLYNYVVPLDFASLYPSLIIAYNFDYTTLVPNDTDLPKDNVNVFEWEDHVACCHDPLVVQKESISKIIENSSDKKQIRDLVKIRSNITKKINKNVMCQKNKFTFLKHEIYGKGVLPTIIDNLLRARKEVRQTMKTVSDPSLLAILNQRQLSYKISANSMYGATGVKSGVLPFMPVAMCVTYTGRESIQKASILLKSLGGTIVYGDTDSNYVTFDDIDGTHLEKCTNIWDKAQGVATQISLQFPSPMRIEFEEVIYYKFMILTKKRYMFYSCCRDGIVSKKIGQKGVLLARRDNSGFVKSIYEKAVMNVFENKSKEHVMDEIINDVLKLVRFQTDKAVLKITKSVNDYNSRKIVFDESTKKCMMGAYIVPTPPTHMSEDEKIKFCSSRLPAQVQLELKMVARGEEKAEGSRLEYIVTQNFGMKKQCDKIEHYKYFVDHSEFLKIDYLYYITHLVDPLEQIFGSIYKTEKFVQTSLSVFEKQYKITNEIKKLFTPKIII